MTELVCFLINAFCFSLHLNALIESKAHKGTFKIFLCLLHLFACAAILMRAS